jgi:Cof subfamily protein (haloacid dehalogenase superfamily)
MGKFSALLLVSDFDDTLYTADHRLPARNLEALDYFIREGGRFTIATGRALRTFAPYAQLTPINAPVILSNGSAIYDFQTSRMLEQTFLPPEAPVHFQATLDAFPALAIEAYHGEDIYVCNPNLVTRSHMQKVGTGYTDRPLAQTPLPWTKGMFQQENALLTQVQDWFLRRYGEQYEAIFSNQFYLEITAKGSTKGAMVAKLAAMLSITPEHVYCVGDNQNDLSMLAFSAIPFAPENCAQQLRDWGARIVCNCEDGVLGDIVQILDEIY